MSSTLSPTVRLIAARPPVAGLLDDLVGADERARLLDQILASDLSEVDPVPAPGRSRPRGPIAVAVAGALAVVLAVTGILAARTRSGQSVGGRLPMSSPSAMVLLAQVTTALDNVHDVAVIDGTTNGIRSTIWTLTERSTSFRFRYTVHGAPNYDQSSSTADGRTTMTVVDFAAHAWWTEELVAVGAYAACASGAKPAANSPTATAVPRTTTSWVATPDEGSSSCSVFGPTPAQIVQNLKDGEFQVTGHPQVDGRPTVEITARYPDARSTLQLFVDASSYLPVMVINTDRGKSFTTTYSYLPAVPANLALLQVAIPAGFRHAEHPVRCTTSQLKAPNVTPFGCAGAPGP